MHTAHATKTEDTRHVSHTLPTTIRVLGGRAPPTEVVTERSAFVPRLRLEKEWQCQLPNQLATTLSSLFFATVALLFDAPNGTYEPPAVAVGRQ